MALFICCSGEWRLHGAYADSSLRAGWGPEVWLQRGMEGRGGELLVYTLQLDWRPAWRRFCGQLLGSWVWTTEINQAAIRIESTANSHLLFVFHRVKPGLCNSLEGWEGEVGRLKRERTYVYRWLIHDDVWQKPTQYCKAIILPLKINKLKKQKT